MKTPTTIKEVFLFAALLVAGFFIFQQSKQISGLKEHNEIVNKQQDEILKANQEKDKVLENKIEVLEIKNEAALKDNERLNEELTELRIKRQSDESDIDNITDPDSLQQLWTEYY